MLGFTFAALVAAMEIRQSIASPPFMQKRSSDPAHRVCSEVLPSGVKKGDPSMQSKIFSHGSAPDGMNRSWLIYVPTSYTGTVPVPLVVATHGWRQDAYSMQDISGMSNKAEDEGFIVAYPNGLYTEQGWGSWNVVGTTLSNSTNPTCDVGHPEYCYDDCGTCSDQPQCWWTTCSNDVTPTGIGTENVNGFLPQLYDLLEEQYCIDKTRLYHIGFSNGAMATYQIGVSMASRIAAIVAFAGSFVHGYTQAPQVPVPLMDVHGDADNEVPANASEDGAKYARSGDGYWYALQSEIFDGWRIANGCGVEDVAKFATPVDNLDGLSCTSIGKDCACRSTSEDCDKAPVVRCTFNGDHEVFTGPQQAANLTWAFLSMFSKTTL